MKTGIKLSKYLSKLKEDLRKEYFLIETTNNKRAVIIHRNLTKIYDIPTIHGGFGLTEQFHEKPFVIWTEKGGEYNGTCSINYRALNDRMLFKRNLGTLFYDKYDKIMKIFSTSIGFKSLMIGADHTLYFVNNGRLLWKRNEGLANIIDSYFIKRPINKTITNDNDDDMLALLLLVLQVVNILIYYNVFQMNL